MTKIEGGVALDTNVLVYAEDRSKDQRVRLAVHLLKQLQPQGYLVPVQVCGEFLRVMVRKARRSPAEALASLDQWFANAHLLAMTEAAFVDASALSRLHHLDIWDAVILAVAAESRCGILLSEDMQDGFVWRGTTVCNPFAEKLHPLLASALRH